MFESVCGVHVLCYVVDSIQSRTDFLLPCIFADYGHTPILYKMFEGLFLSNCLVNSANDKYVRVSNAKYVWVTTWNETYVVIVKVALK